MSLLVMNMNDLVLFFSYYAEGNMEKHVFDVANRN